MERPQDALLRQATPQELEVAKAATLAIERLGSHRGRDLPRLLQEALASRRR
jgi:hypothetical protein